MRKFIRCLCVFYSIIFIPMVSAVERSYTFRGPFYYQEHSGFVGVQKEDQSSIPVVIQRLCRQRGLLQAEDFTLGSSLEASVTIIESNWKPCFSCELLLVETIRCSESVSSGDLPFEIASGQRDAGAPQDSDRSPHVFSPQTADALR